MYRRSMAIDVVYHLGCLQLANELSVFLQYVINLGAIAIEVTLHQRMDILSNIGLMTLFQHVGA